MTLELVFDFDGTVTEEDSIASLVEAALGYHRANSSAKTYHHLANAWEKVVESYKSDLEAYHRGFEPPLLGDDSAPLDIARNLFSNEHRQQTERASLLRVQRAGLFYGVPLDHLSEAGQEHREKGVVNLRSGFPDLIRLARNHSVLKQMGGIHILSVNWSASYIRGVLSKEQGISSVIANDISATDGSINAVPAVFDDDASKDWPRVLTVGSEKLSALVCLHRQQNKAKSGLPVEITYFGDSTTDLECLLEFGGVVLSPRTDDCAQRAGTQATPSNAELSGGGELLRILRSRLNMNVPHVSKYNGELVCWAYDFAEIMESRFLQKRAANMKSTKT